MPKTPQDTVADRPTATTPDDDLNSDDANLRAQGHRAEFARSYSWFGATCLAYSISNSWLGYAATIGTPLAYGGGLTTMVGIVLAAVAFWIIYLGVAELASAFPCTGGPYHFTSILAPNPIKKPLAFVVGLADVFAWWVTTASGIIYTAISAFGVVSFWYPHFHQHPWQVYLVYVLMIILSLIPIFTVKPKKIDDMCIATMILSVAGLLAVIITCGATGHSHFNIENFTQYRGSSGWPQGPAWLLSITVGMYAYAGAGAMMHIAEEVPRPKRYLPLGINGAMLIGILSAIPYTVIIVGGIQDMDKVQKAPVPNIEILYQATGSKAAAAALQSYMTFLYYTCLPPQWITCSRISWAFARDVGLPFSQYWYNLSPRFEIPVRTTFLSAAFCLLYGLIYIASTAAFNTIVSMTVLFLTFTYVAPQAILLFGAREKLPPRYFNLGRWGYAVNAFSVVWFCVAFVLFCFPTTLPTSKGSMNYGSVVVVGIFIIIGVVYLTRKGKFVGPRIDREALGIPK